MLFGICNGIQVHDETRVEVSQTVLADMDAGDTATVGITTISRHSTNGCR